MYVYNLGLNVKTETFVPYIVLRMGKIKGLFKFHIGAFTLILTTSGCALRALGTMMYWGLIHPPPPIFNFFCV